MGRRKRIRVSEELAELLEELKERQGFRSKKEALEEGALREEFRDLLKGIQKDAEEILGSRNKSRVV